MDIANGDTAEVVERARAAVSAVHDPEIGLPLGELGMVRSVELDGDVLKVLVALTIPGCPLKDRIRNDIAAAVSGFDGIERVEIAFEAMGDAEREALASRLQPATTKASPFADGRTAIVAIASGKGGVGKSTVTVNLACALAAAGKRVGVLDADVWGFSIPRMLGASGTPVGFNGMLLPLEAHGVKAVSAGFFADERTPIVWRGPMLHKAMEQFLNDVYWGELDVLLCDLPPGTGDVPISLAAMLPDASAVIVTTPQEAAAAVAERAGRMAAQAHLRIAGVIENMASFACPCCGETTEIFGEGGGEAIAHALAAPLLARIPLSVGVRAAGDAGLPIVLADPEAPTSQAFREAADRLLEAVRPRTRLPLIGERRVPVATGAAGEGSRR